MKTKLLFLLLTIIPLINHSQSRSWDGKGVRPDEKIHMLNIFIRVIYQPGETGYNIPTAAVFNNYDENTEGVNNYHIPYMLNFMDTTCNVHPLNGNMTRRFYESSFGSLQLTGDFIYVNVKKSTVISKYKDVSASAVFSAAIDLINEHGFSAQYAKTNIKRFDHNGDKKIDYTQVIFLNTHSDFGEIKNGNGNGSLPNTTSFILDKDGQRYSLVRGTRQCKNDNLSGDYCSIVHHEFAHSLFGGNDFHTSGGNHWGSSEYMPFLTIQHGHGLMGGAGCCLLSCNGYERWRMHWKLPQAIDYIAALNLSGQSVKSDVCKDDGKQTFILRDFVTYGDVVRIKLPYKDSEHASNQYIWLENHQVGKNDKIDFHQYADNGYNKCRGFGTAGIYAYYQVGRDILEGTSEQVRSPNERDNLKMISAEGYWDYSIVDMVYQSECINYDTCYQFHRRDTPNPFNGYQDQEMQFHPEHRSENILSTKQCYNIRFKQINGVFEKNLAGLGDRFDAFGTHSKIGMSTNPSTCNAKTYYSFITNGGTYDYTDQAYRNNRATYLTGLSIEMLPMPDGSSWKVIIRWDDYNITNSAIWTGKVSLKEKAVLTSGNTINLKQNKTPEQFIKDPNTGYFAPFSNLTLENGSIFELKSGSRMFIEDKSSLILKTGSTLIIEDNAQMYISPESKLIIEPCARLIIKGKGELQLQDKCDITVNKGSLISIENYENIVIHQWFYLNDELSRYHTSNLAQVFEAAGLLLLPTLSGTKTITGDYIVASPININQGGDLTVTGTLSFIDDASIKIKQGGKVTIDGGTLQAYNNCQTNTWKGIEVWGTSNASQTVTTTGQLILKNATIKDAETAVMLAARYTPNSETVNPGTPIFNAASKDPSEPIKQYTHSGGKVTATSTLFINNQCHVEFYPYNYSNSSSFKECEFKITENIDKLTNRMVYINGAKNILFEGCRFERTDNVNNYDIRAIHAYNATFRIYPKCMHEGTGISHTTPWCNPNQDSYYTTFNNLRYGVYATSAGGTMPYTIKYAKFENTDRAIYSSGIDNISITDCKINVPAPDRVFVNPNPGDLNQNNSNYGIYCNGSTGYQIEGNTIIGVNKGSYLDNGKYKKNTLGIIVNNSGGSANKVYNNTLQRLEVGAQAQGENRNPATGVGLCFTCNDFSTNKTDIAVTAATVQQKNSIAEYQYNKGSRPAANGFTWDSYSDHIYDMYNYQNGTLILYMTFSNNYEGRKYIMTQYSKSYDETKAIKQWNYSGQYLGRDKECSRTPYNQWEIVDGTVALRSAGQNISNSNNQLNSLIDGGNSTVLLSAIDNATENNSFELRKTLISNSPYLSDEVVIGAIENETAINNVTVRDIIVGNSHTARQQEVITALNNKNNSLPDYMLNQIKIAAENNISGLDKLRINLQENLDKYNEVFTSVMQNISEKQDIDQWENLMKNSIEENINKGYVIYNVLNGKNTEANEIINLMNNSDSLLTVFTSVITDSTNFGKLTENAVSSLLEISHNDNRIGVFASNILGEIGSISYEEPIFEINYNNSFKNTALKTANTNSVDTKDKLNIYPNPADEYIIVEYDANNLSDDLMLSITDINGKTLKSEKLIYKKDALQINLEGFIKGNYIVNIVSENNIVYSKKLIIK